jgi:tyrosinase
VFGAVISNAGEQDTFKFVVASAGNYVIETGGSTDVITSLYGPNSMTKLIARDDDSGAGANSRIEASLQPGTYYLQIRHYSSIGTGPYKVWVAG